MDEIEPTDPKCNNKPCPTSRKKGRLLPDFDKMVQKCRGKKMPKNKPSLVPWFAKGRTWDLDPDGLLLRVFFLEFFLKGDVSLWTAPLSPLEWYSFLPLVAAVLITLKGAELPGSGRIGVIGALVFFPSEAVQDKLHSPWPAQQHTKTLRRSRILWGSGFRTCQNLIQQKDGWHGRSTLLPWRPLLQTWACPYVSLCSSMWDSWLGPLPVWFWKNPRDPNLKNV